MDTQGTQFEIASLTKFWHLMYSVIQDFWGIVEPRIEEAAVENEVPVELYYYGELALDYFSVENFQKRDPFSNPEQFERQFARLDVKGWIEPVPDGQYRVTSKAREGLRRIIEAGNACLPSPESMPDVDLERLKVLIKQAVLANDSASEPPEKWAILKRLRVAGRDSPVLVKIREYLMDLFAYRDDAYIAAARPHFNQAGIVWLVFGAVWSGEAANAEQMAERMVLRGYEPGDFEAALQAAAQVGWIEEADVSGTYRVTKSGEELHENVERLTNEYFYHPWSVYMQEELDELYDLLTKLHVHLSAYRKPG